MHHCTICRRQLTDAEADRYACQACVYRMRAALREIPRQLPLLTAALAPGNRPARGRSGGRAHAPLPVHEDVLDLLGPGTIAPVPDPHGDQTGGIPLGPLLYGWAHHIATHHPAVHIDRHGTQQITPCIGAVARHGTGITAWCTWLTAYLPYAAHHPWIDALHDQLDEALRRIRVITGTAVRRRTKLAPCPACSTFGLIETDGEWDIDCQACGHRMTRDAYAEHAEDVLQHMDDFRQLLAAQDAAGHDEGPADAAA